MKRFLPLVLLSALFAWSTSWGQNPNTSWLPVGLNGETGPTSTLGESGVNQLSVGIAGGVAYDTSASNSSGYESYTVNPSIAIIESRPRTALSVQYSPGYTREQQGAGAQFMQTLLGSTQIRLSEKVTLQLTERYLRMDSWFTGLQVNPTASGGNVIQTPNESILTRGTVIASSSSSLNLVYQASESTVAGLQGSFNTGNFSEVQVTLNQPLFNFNSGSAGVYVSHRMQGKNWLGVTGNFQRIDTTGNTKEGADNPSLQLFYTFAPSAYTSVSLFAGPSYFTSQAETAIDILGTSIPLTIPSHGWGTNFGATLGWRTQRNGISGMYMHRISDGGGLSGATSSDSAKVNFRRQLSQRWTASGTVIFGKNNSKSVLYGASFQQILGTANLNWSLSEHFSVMLSYGRDDLHSSYTNLVAGNTTIPTGSNNQTIGENRAWATISYSFTRPLGR
jgi:hypothetical protein